MNDVTETETDVTEEPLSADQLALRLRRQAMDLESAARELRIVAGILQGRKATGRLPQVLVELVPGE